MSFHKIAVSGVRWTTLGTFGGALFQILQISILTRFLPKEAFGLVAMALFVVNLSHIFVDMGMSSAILHHQNATRNEYSSIYWLNIVVSFFLYILLCILTPLIAAFYNEGELNKLVPILGVNLLLIAAGRQHRTILQKQFKFRTIALTELFSYFLGLLSAVILAINSYGVYSLVYSTLLSSLISNSLFLTLNLRQNPVSFHFRRTETLPFIKIGGFTMGSTFLDFFSREIDILIIGKMLGAENLGLYTLAKQIIIKLYSFINPIVLNVLSPILSTIQKDGERVKDYYLKVVYILATINFPIYLFIIVLSIELLTVIYGTEYSSGFWVLGYLSISYATYTISNPVGSLQIATGRTDLGLVWTIVRVLTTPVFIYIAAHFSINLVAATLALLSITLILPLWRIQLKPMAQIKLKEYLQQFIKPYLILLFIAGIYFIGSNFYELPFGTILNAFLKGISFGLLYFGMLWIFEKQRIIEIYRLVLNQLKPIPKNDAR